MDARLSGSGVVSYQRGGVRLSAPLGEYTIAERPNGNYESQDSMKSYVIDCTDVQQYVEIIHVKVGGQWP